MTGSNFFNFRATLLLSIQRALWGEITSNIRGITCSWDDSTITIRWLFDGEISDEDLESAECNVTGEVNSDFPDHEVVAECKRLDMPEPLSPYVLSVWVYMRKEKRL